MSGSQETTILPHPSLPPSSLSPLPPDLPSSLSHDSWSNYNLSGMMLIMNNSHPLPLGNSSSRKLRQLFTDSSRSVQPCLSCPCFCNLKFTVRPSKPHAPPPAQLPLLGIGQAPSKPHFLEPLQGRHRGDSELQTSLSLWALHLDAAGPGAAQILQVISHTDFQSWNI